MEIGETLYVKDREAWRTWLEMNHDSEKEIWLIYYKKHTGKPVISYDDSVEEALCFGWIDSTVKRLDDEKYARRYTPRRPKSVWSVINMKRVQRMIKEGRMTEHGLAKIPREVLEGKVKGRVVPGVLPMPPELEKALAGNPKAMKNWERFAPSPRKMYIHWIMDAKRQETRERRIKKLITMVEENKKPMM